MFDEILEAVRIEEAIWIVLHWKLLQRTPDNHMRNLEQLLTSLAYSQPKFLQEHTY